jgi:ribosome recycling factor
MLDDIRVEAYGDELPLNQVASLAAPEPRLLTVQPWDKSVIPAIEKAIMKSSLGLTPSTQGDLIRIPVPPLTEERRKEFSKMCRSLGEDTKVALRNVRREVLKELEKEKKDGDLPEDDHHKLADKVEEMTKSHVDKVDEMVKRKEADIMEV